MLVISGLRPKTASKRKLNKNTERVHMCRHAQLSGVHSHGSTLFKCHTSYAYIILKSKYQRWVIWLYGPINSAI